MRSGNGGRSLKVALGVAAGWGALGVFGAAPAGAGVYHVYSCRTPAGAVAPVSGWSGSTSGPWMYDPDSCASGGSLTAALDGGVEQGANVSDAAWAFSAASGTQIVGARLWRAGEARTGRAYGTTVFWLAAPSDIYDAADIFDKCEHAEEGCTARGNPGAPMAHENLLEVPPGNLGGATHLFMNAACGGGDGFDCPSSGGGDSVWVSLYAADITLADDSPPTVSDIGGSLMAGGTLSGVGDISFSAADSGSGLYEAVFLVDGRVVSRQLLNGGSGPCRDVGGTSDGANAFFAVEPCPLALSDDLSFDTALAPDGSHLFTVQLLDAAGNATTIANRQVTFANATTVAPVGGAIGPGSPLALRGAPNGANASDQAKLTAGWQGTRRATRRGGASRATRTGSYGRADLAAGRLTAPGGVPISGAAIEVYATSAYEGARTVPLAVVHTGPAGEWTLTLPHGTPSSALRFEYRSHQNDTIPVATAALTLRVHAGIALRIAPRATSAGHTIHFSGVLRGAPVPPGGKQLVLEASAGGEWLQFRTIATDARGRYHAAYRFKFPGPITYRFRVYAPREADFPFLAGTSNVVEVHER